MRGILLVPLVVSARDLPHVGKGQTMLNEYTLAELLEYMPRNVPTSCRDSAKYSPAVNYNEDTWAKHKLSWSWNPSDPTHIMDAYSLTKFPNPSFKTVKKEVVSAAGWPLMYDFVLPKEKSNLKQYCREIRPDGIAKKVCEEDFNNGVWLDGCLAAHQAPFFHEHILAGLANSYEATKNEKYAERALELLDAWASIWKTYPFRYPSSAIFLTPQDCDGSDGAGCQLASRYEGIGHELDDVPLDPFQKVKQSSSAAFLSAKKGYDVIAHISDNIFKREADFFLPGGGSPPLNILIKENVMGWAPLLGRLGLELGDRKYANFLMDYLEGASGSCGRDGFWMSSFMYGQHAMRGLAETACELKRYFERHPPRTRAEMSKAKRLSSVEELLVAGNEGLFQVQQPNGVWPANGDNSREGFYKGQPSFLTSGGKDGKGSIKFCPGKFIPVERTNSSAMLPAYGHLALRGQAGADAAQVQLEFQHAGYHGHSPPMVNSISLSAFRHTVHDNFRYERTRLRMRNEFTGAWNTVLINQASQTPAVVEAHCPPGLCDAGDFIAQENPRLSPVASENGPDGAPWVDPGGDAVLFEPALDGTGLSVAEVDGYRAYYPWTQPGAYSRLLVHNTYDPDFPYTLDVFRVVGGEQHEYTLKGDTMYDMEALPGYPVEAITGAHPLLGPGYGTWDAPPFPFGFKNPHMWYGAYRNVSSGRYGVADDSAWDLTFRGKCDGTEAWHYCGRDDKGNVVAPQTKIWGLTPDSELITAEQPHNYRASPPLHTAEPIGPNSFWTQTLLERRKKRGATDPATATAGGDEPLSSLFVHVLEPHRYASEALKPRAILSVQRLPLKTEDGRSVAVKVTRRDGRNDVIVVRLTPASGGYEAELPLEQPTLEPVETADGKYKLQGHVGMISQAFDADIKVVVGPGEAHQYIDGSKAKGAGAVYEGAVTGVGSDDHPLHPHFFETDALHLPEGSVLAGKWLSLSMGSYKPSKTMLTQKAGGKTVVNGHDKQNDSREMFEIASVELSALSVVHVQERSASHKRMRIRLRRAPHLRLAPSGPHGGGGGHVLLETKRPGRRFGGPLRRSFRIVTSSVHVELQPYWRARAFEDCTAVCGQPAQVFARQVVCQDPYTGDRLEEDRCRMGKPATQKSCMPTPRCGRGRFIRIRPKEENGQLRFLQEIEVFAQSVTPEKSLEASIGLSDNAIVLKSGGRWSLSKRTTGLWTVDDKTLTSVRSPVMANGRPVWGSPAHLLDRSLVSGEITVTTEATPDGEMCELVLDLGATRDVGVVRVFGSEKEELEVSLLTDSGAGDLGPSAGACDTHGEGTERSMVTECALPLPLPDWSVAPTAAPTLAPTHAWFHDTPERAVQPSVCHTVSCKYRTMTTNVFGHQASNEKWHCENVGAHCICMCHEHFKCTLRHHGKEIHNC